MKKTILLLIMTFGCTSFATIINFNDIATPGGSATLPTDYQGFSWTGGWKVEGQTGSSGWSVYNNQYNFPSLNNAADDGGASLVSLSSLTPFSLDSFYLATWGYNNTFKTWSTRTVTVKGYLDDTEVYSTAVSLGLGFSQVTSFSGLGVDKVDFLASSGSWWLIDNISVAPIETMPEPTTICLLGLGALSLLRRKK
jgi:hypothetical protein